MKVPISKLVRDYHQHSQRLIKNRALAQEQRSQPTDTKKFRELMENVTIAAEKSHEITSKINMAYSMVLTDWSPADLAMVLTGLDVRLFIMLCPREAFNGITEFTDFQSYLKMILENELSDREEADCLIRVELLLKTAFLCIYVYRNLNSGKTLVSTVHSFIEAQKLRSKLNSKMVLLEAHLSEMFADVGKLGLNMLYHHQKINEISIISNGFMIKKELEDIHLSCTAHESKESGLILSEQGQKRLERLISLVECCQGKVKMSIELSKQDTKTKMPKLDMEIPMLPSNDLKVLGIGNLVLEHWILTRVLKDEQND